MKACALEEYRNVATLHSAHLASLNLVPLLDRSTLRRSSNAQKPASSASLHRDGREALNRVETAASTVIPLDDRVDWRRGDWGPAGFLPAWAKQSYRKHGSGATEYANQAIINGPGWDNRCLLYTLDAAEQ